MAVKQARVSVLEMQDVIEGMDSLDTGQTCRVGTEARLTLQTAFMHL